MFEVRRNVLHDIWCLSQEIRLILGGLILFLCSLNAMAQQPADSLKVAQLPMVTIGGEYYKTASRTSAVQTITAQQLSHLPTLQVADALKFMSGVVVKDYGGTGGLKTVSVRGLGSQHTGVIYDGIALNDCQTGQIDLSKLSLDNVNSISMIIGEMGMLVPARLFSYSNVIKINTIQNMPDKPFHMKVALTTGSFGLISPQISCENIIRSKRRSDRYFLWNLSANYLKSKGDYPFTVYYGDHGDSTSRERRQNADITTLHVETNAQYKPSANQNLQIKWYYFGSDRGLPSNVHYSLNSMQRLRNHNTFGQLSYQQRFSPKWSYLLAGKFNYDYTFYLDPQYLNEAHQLANTYEQYEGYISNTVKYSPLYKHKGWDVVDNPVELHFALSNDVFYNQLEGNSIDYIHPRRLTTLTALSALYFNKVVRVNANLLFTTIHNASDDDVEIPNYLHLSPLLNVSVALHKTLTLRAFYKDIFRMPTFNDLYYRDVGNLNLRPEKTKQWDFGLTYIPQRFAHGKMDFSATMDGYFNIVKDKIVAFPSRNLFSWTMLNYGKVWIAGAEVNANWQYQFVKRYFLRLNGNCTYQKAIDRTDANGKTFNHQIPYVPKWSGSGSVSIDLPWVTVSYSILACGKRYCLSENIPANIVEGYCDQSLGIGHEFTIKETKLGVRLEMLNIANKSYQIIRNYPMQGRSFRAKIWFEY